MNAQRIIDRARRIYEIPDGCPRDDRNVVSMCGGALEHGRRLVTRCPLDVADAVLDLASDGYKTNGGTIIAVGPDWAVQLTPQD